MGYYTKNPITVEAVQVRHGNEQEVVDFLNKYHLKWWAVKNYGIRIHTGTSEVLVVEELEWIVHDIDGRVRVVDNKLFLASYTPERTVDRYQISFFDVEEEAS